MGQAVRPLSEQSQQLNATANATADGSGNAVFLFQAPQKGYTWTGTVVLANAPTNAHFVATIGTQIGGTSWGDWYGNSVFGPVQALGGQVLAVVATGLTPGQGYLMEWTGSSDPADLVAPIWPDATASTAHIAGDVVIQPLGPLDVVPYGGLRAVVGSLNNTSGAINLIGPPAAGKAYRLQRWQVKIDSSSPNVFSMPASSRVMLFCTGPDDAGLVLDYAYGPDPDTGSSDQRFGGDLGGQLVTGAIGAQLEGVIDPTAVWLTLDLVNVPVIS